MGYEIRIEGSIDLNPPVPYAAFRESAFRLGTPKNRTRTPSLLLDVITDEQDTPDGIFLRHTAVAIHRSTMWPAAGDVQTELAALATELPDGTTTTGYLTVYGENPLDFYRLYLHGREVIRVDPEIRWPLYSHGLGPDAVEGARR